MPTYLPQQFRGHFETDLGRALWEYLNEPETIIRLERASELGQPALKKMGRRILDRFGEQVRENTIKQMLGHMVRQILEPRGFVFVRAHQKFEGDPLFSSAARYAQESQ